ncbi:MAG: hypothetical protein JWO89_712 [Verrucomicrobiaceae bacterium]|nr:hypothetical protein [Verrucomicrobiaceae bacterium]MDB6118338.1 hypothetical protein [Verrucomicrobiaceae bacterium]
MAGVNGCTEGGSVIRLEGIRTLEEAVTEGASVRGAGGEIGRGVVIAAEGGGGMRMGAEAGTPAP